ncbi:G-type lectin S-receptor-like serine/threonine-protein kinase SD1-13 isoform X2 [Punica granatum]|uniref:Receptor-like serine/threonine-protein kinase n=1 Tax=Punica granatum TaxID=22663 RepID=A0A218WYC8_PUNGR|nr:G-type lectin S-receptor-like serine/threonine-protein kinase SD1-13 isoform X2 [Punica granatum]OWM77578.1 hypothetical protein CDL15_Pgr016976 [Punica granatum]
MMLIGGASLLFVLLLLSCFASEFSTATDFVSWTRYLQDPESITSNGSVFRMGFFTPKGSKYRYVGIWYNNYPEFNPVWVANRERPIEDSLGTVMISEDGNLVIMDGKKDVVWSSNVTTSARGNKTAHLLDTGNLVLHEANTSTSDEVIWQSFEHVSDSFLPKMKLSSNARTNVSVMLTSWKSSSDPSPGPFSGGINPLNIPEAFVWNGTRPYWRSGPWNGQIFIGLASMESVYLDGFSLQNDNEGTFSLTYKYAMAYISYYLLQPNGTLLQVYSGEEENDRGLPWSSYETECDVYGKCGPYGICDPSKSPICSCPRGFKPGNLEEWSRGNWTAGCVRETPTNCGSSNSSKRDGFLRLQKMKVPAFPEWSFPLENECAKRCLSNCSCLAYAYTEGVGCMSWTGDLLDMQKFSNAGVDIHIRLPRSELGKARDLKLVLAVTLSVGVVFITLSVLLLWMRARKRRVTKLQETVTSDREESPIISSGKRIQDNLKLQDLKLLSFEELSTATDSFSSATKLGEGGFGPVYMGKLLDGQEVAIKRLSRASDQGLEEFMNEMVVISKVQHRNLVRLLGCCVEREEKILVYEFMPNKSLDEFLFDPVKKDKLDWSKRFKIIDGICRGLLYLHRDSRLRIIHRDLKASNILLDEELNPKISDFGMARIFGAKEDQANTRRVVGTYGYMAPEYAMGGLFSEKSDVFSFGVLLLEIISGRRNTSFSQEEQYCSLLGFAWTLWNEGNIMALVDPVISNNSHQIEVRRCIHVGLLCTQELGNDRPTTSTVISMLNSEITDLRIPKRPAFTERQITHDTESSEQSEGTRSINHITITTIEGR